MYLVTDGTVYKECDTDEEAFAHFLVMGRDGRPMRVFECTPVDIWSRVIPILNDIPREDWKLPEVRSSLLGDLWPPKKPIK